MWTHVVGRWQHKALLQPTKAASSTRTALHSESRIPKIIHPCTLTVSLTMEGEADHIAAEKLALEALRECLVTR